MPLVNSPSREAFKSNLKAELAANRPKAQALAIAFDVQRRAKRADGGGINVTSIDRALRIAGAPQRADGGMTQMPRSPAQMRRTADNPYGFSLGTGGGRTDKNNVSVAGGAYVLPADVIAGMGDGNSLAGAAVWDKYLNSMPWGIDPPKLSRGRGPPPPPGAAPGQSAGISQRQTQTPLGGLADGGMFDQMPGETPIEAEPEIAEEAEEIPIQAADGEIILAPEDVLRVGQYYAPDRLRDSGDIEAMIAHGHKLLDEFVKTQRGRHIAHLQSLKGPVGSRNASVGHIKVKE